MSDADAVTEMRWRLLDADECMAVVLSVVIHSARRELNLHGKVCHNPLMNRGGVAAVQWAKDYSGLPPLGVTEINEKGLFHTLFINQAMERIYSLNIF